MSLYIVATPIGNLEDITTIAINVLSRVGLIAAEDTRHSRMLMEHFGINTPLVAYHDHNEAAATDSLIKKLLSGLDVALISDAGTPLISDPGYRIVKQARDAGIQVIPVPGPSAVLAALSVSGLPTDRFKFEGFLPAKTVARQARLEALKTESATLVFYEAPHRIEKTVEDLVVVFGAARIATVAREMTKKFEQIEHGHLSELLESIQSGTIVSRGEFVVVVGGCSEPVSNVDEMNLMMALLQELPPRKAANVAHKVTGVSKKNLYEIALSLKQNSL